jgi:hypothetical protein
LEFITKKILGKAASCSTFSIVRKKSLTAKIRSCRIAGELPPPEGGSFLNHRPALRLLANPKEGIGRSFSGYPGGTHLFLKEKR